MLVEIDLEGNPVTSVETILEAIITKKDLLVLNLRQSVLAKESPEDVLATAKDSNILSEARALMSLSHNGVLYKSKRVY